MKKKTLKTNLQNPQEKKEVKFLFQLSSEPGEACFFPFLVLHNFHKAEWMMQHAKSSTPFLQHPQPQQWQFSRTHHSQHVQRTNTSVFCTKTKEKHEQNTRWKKGTSPFVSALELHRIGCSFDNNSTWKAAFCAKATSIITMQSLASSVRTRNEHFFVLPAAAHLYSQTEAFSPKCLQIYALPAQVLKDFQHEISAFRWRCPEIPHYLSTEFLMNCSKPCGQLVSYIKPFLNFISLSSWVWLSLIRQNRMVCASGKDDSYLIRESPQVEQFSQAMYDDNDNTRPSLFSRAVLKWFPHFVLKITALGG